MKQLAVWLHTGQLPLQLSFTLAPMKSPRLLLHPQSHTMSAAAIAARRWQGLDGIGRLLFMIKRVLFSGGLLLGAAYLGCGGDSGPGGTSLTQKPSVVTDRNSIVDTLCKGALRRETLQVTNHGVEDLVINRSPWPPRIQR